MQLSDANDLATSHATQINDERIRSVVSREGTNIYFTSTTSNNLAINFASNDITSKTGVGKIRLFAV